jgi:hypothetical protein
MTALVIVACMAWLLGERVTAPGVTETRYFLRAPTNENVLARTGQ